MDATIDIVIGDTALVFAIASLLGMAARKFGQPAVIGQILVGVLLGPSLLGRIPGNPTSHIFPSIALPYLNVLSQIAVVIFMFTVGYEIEFKLIRQHNRVIPLIALGAFLVPLTLGITCVLLLRPELASVGIVHDGRSFVLFMGVATSITALPVLAAIVRDRNLAGTTIGVIATAAAGLMDVLAWLVLAAALIGATNHSSTFSLPITVVLICCFTIVMLTVVRPALSWWTTRRQSVLSSSVPVAFVLAMTSAWITASLGLHPMFGAFLAGLTMRGGTRTPDMEVLRAMGQAGGIFMPLFFVVTGLSLNVGAMRGDAVLLLAVIGVIACAGKLIPGYFIPRASGLTRRDSAAISALVNTRGLTELIALNAGLAGGIINSQLFTILVLMAIITTLATGPLLSIIKIDETPRITTNRFRSTTKSG